MGSHFDSASALDKVIKDYGPKTARELCAHYRTLPESQREEFRDNLQRALIKECVEAAKMREYKGYDLEG